MAAPLQRIASCFLSIFVLFSLQTGAQAATPPASTTEPQVLYLHTEFLPYEHNHDKDFSNRLSREIMRQAVLIAAREGLGLQTCDETLQESPPDNAEVVHLLLVERGNREGSWHVKLSKYVEGQDSNQAPALWEKTYNHSASIATIYADMIPKLEADTRGPFIEALTSAGLRSAKPTAPGEATPPPPESILQLLLIPDFVAQFGVVRAAHQSIAAHGETPEWLGVLAKGYANLAALTGHHWNSATEVFTARAWIYAQRLATRDPKSSSALRTRAYAWALGGCFHHALADFEQLKKLDSSPGPNAAAVDAAWSKLIESYATSNRGGVKKAGLDTAELSPWSAYLNFRLADFARYPEWMYEAAREVGEKCPTAYDAFDELAHHGQMLGVVRTGASFAPQAFAHFLPISLGKLPDLPPEIGDILPTNEKKQAALNDLVNDPNPNDGFSAVPAFMAGKLREHSRLHANGDLSWSALASLIEEEQFVQAALFLKVAMNATETPLQEIIASLLPLVKGHRYAAHIESLELGNVRDPNRLFEFFGTMEVRDPRQNMYPMFYHIGLLKDAQGTPIGPALVDRAGRNFTLPGLVEFLFPVGPGAMNSDRILAYAEEVQTIAPGSPVGPRLLVQGTSAPKPDDLAAWEKIATDDAITWMAIATHYQKLGDNTAAVRCWERSIAANPSVQAATDLANFHRAQGDLKKWEETLVEFLKTPDLGIQHSVVQRQLALGLAHMGEWQKARPHALAAAQTYSNGGLSMGSYITEGLAEWELSEQLIRAASTAYPTHAGAEWYMWCRRTGRGDLTTATPLAAKFFELPQPHPTEATYVVRGMYNVLKGDLQTARDAFQQAQKIRPTFTNTGFIAQLSRELNDEPARTEAIAAMEKEIAAPSDGVPRDAVIDNAGAIFLELLKSGKQTNDRLAAFDEALLKIDDARRSSCAAWWYFVGNELESLGRGEEAQKYWRRVLVDPNRQQNVAVLAGAKLADLNGTSRPDGDALDADDLWPAPRKK